MVLIHTVYGAVTTAMKIMIADKYSLKSTCLAAALHVGLLRLFW